MRDRVIYRYALAQAKTRVSWRSGGTQILVTLHVDGARVGHLVGDRVLRLSDCGGDVDRLKARGLETDEYWIIQNTFLEPYLRGEGLGKKLYETAFDALAKKRGPLYVAPYACRMGSGTSPDAKRVWQSLSSRYPSAGFVLYLK